MSLQVTKRTLDSTNFSLTPTWDVYDGDQKLGWIENDHAAFEAHAPDSYGCSVHRTLDLAVDCLVQKSKDLALHETCLEYADLLNSPANAWGQHCHPVYGISHRMLANLYSKWGKEDVQKCLAKIYKQMSP